MGAFAFNPEGTISFRKPQDTRLQGQDPRNQLTAHKWMASR
jgi:hypothetical protein